MIQRIMFCFVLLFLAAGAALLGIYAHSAILGGGIFLVAFGLVLGTNQW